MIQSARRATAKILRSKHKGGRPGKRSKNTTTGGEKRDLPANLLTCDQAEKEVRCAGEEERERTKPTGSKKEKETLRKGGLEPKGIGEGEEAQHKLFPDICALKRLASGRRGKLGRETKVNEGSFYRKRKELREQGRLQKKVPPQVDKFKIYWAQNAKKSKEKKGKGSAPEQQGIYH